MLCLGNPLADRFPGTAESKTEAVVSGTSLSKDLDASVAHRPASLTETREHASDPLPNVSQLINFLH